MRWKRWGLGNREVEFGGRPRLSYLTSARRIDIQRTVFTARLYVILVYSIARIDYTECKFLYPKILANPFNRLTNRRHCHD